MRFSIRSILVAATVIGAACSIGQDISYPNISGAPHSEEFIANLTGGGEIPAVTTTATGTAYLAVIDDSILTYRVDVATIDSTTASHIHSGSIDSVGPVIVTLFTGPTIAATGCTTAQLVSPRCRVGYTGPLNQNQVKYSALTLPAAWGTTARERFDSLVARMRTGWVYVNVHNRANASGHIRAQVAPQ